MIAAPASRLSLTITEAPPAVAAASTRSARASWPGRCWQRKHAAARAAPAREPDAALDERFHLFWPPGHDQHILRAALARRALRPDTLSATSRKPISRSAASLAGWNSVPSAASIWSGG